MPKTYGGQLIYITTVSLMTFHSPTEIDYTFYILLGYKFVTISLQMHLLIQLFNIQVSFSDIIHSNKPTSKSTIYKLD